MIYIHQTDECTEELDRRQQIEFWAWITAFTLIDVWVIAWILS
jgi:hypothetical protein